MWKDPKDEGVDEVDSIYSVDITGHNINCILYILYLNKNMKKMTINNFYLCVCVLGINMYICCGW